MGTGTYGTRNARPGDTGIARLGKYYLQVTAPDALDVVASAGGWLVDRAMAGWDVTVTLTADCDPRPLRILGVNTRVVESGDAANGPLHSQSYALSTAALTADDELRGAVLSTLRRGVAEVTVWGTAGPELTPGLVAVQHALSSAARAFKARALQAAGSAAPVRAVESFHSRPSALTAGYSDLTPSAVATALAHR